MRIYENLYECAKETQRELHEMGIKVILKTFQNKNVESDESRNTTKELQGYTFKVLYPDFKVEEAYDLMYKDPKTQRRWVNHEFAERVSQFPVNPGTAWKEREDTWKPFLDKNGCFDYTYNERFLLFSQLERVIEHLKEDLFSRRGVVNIYNNIYDLEGLESLKRVPCSVTYSWLYRENKLNMFYHMRSSDFYEHFLNDMFLAAKMNEYVAKKLNVEIGYLTVYINSLHAYKIDLDKRGIF